MSHFSPRVHKLLTKAGWSSYRSIETGEIESWLNRNGYVLFPKAREFLSEFGDLTVEYVHSGKRYELRFNASSVAGNLVQAQAAELYSAPTNVEFCPIGENTSTGESLLMDQNGNVYGAFDDFLRLIGRSGDEGIENILTQARTIEQVLPKDTA